MLPAHTRLPADTRLPARRERSNRAVPSATDVPAKRNWPIRSAHERGQFMTDPQREQLTLSLRRAEDVCVLHATGEIDIATAPKLTKLLRTALESNPRLLVMELTDVDFLGSAGLAALIEARKLAGEATRVVLAGTTRRVVDRALQTSGLATLFDHYPTTEQATASRPEHRRH